MNTPHLELDIVKVEELYRRFIAALPDFEVYYSVKTNDDPRVLATLKHCGAKFEIVSPSDLEAIANLNVTGEEVIHSNPVAHHDNITAAYAYGVRVFTCQSRATIDAIAEHAPNCNVVVRVSMPKTNKRATINLDKFGVGIHEVGALIEYARSKRLTPCGLTFHVGGQNVHPTSWVYALHQALPVMERYDLTLCDISGGFPAQFRGDEPSIEMIGKIIAPVVKHYSKRSNGSIKFAAEPGRYIAAEAGTLVYTVLDVHQRGKKTYVYIDGSIFGPLKMYVHHPYPVSVDGKEDAPVKEYVLTTNTCDGKDIIDSMIKLPVHIKAGDTLRFHKAGAYTKPFVNLEYAGLKKHAVVYV